MPFCRNCGIEINETDKFCIKCGEKINQEKNTPVTVSISDLKDLTSILRNQMLQDTFIVENWDVVNNGKWKDLVFATIEQGYRDPAQKNNYSAAYENIQRCGGLFRIENMDVTLLRALFMHSDLFYITSSDVRSAIKKVGLDRNKTEHNPGNISFTEEKKQLINALMNMKSLAETMEKYWISKGIRHSLFFDYVETWKANIVILEKNLENVTERPLIFPKRSINEIAYENAVRDALKARHWSEYERLKYVFLQFGDFKESTEWAKKMNKKMLIKKYWGVAAAVIAALIIVAAIVYFTSSINYKLYNDNYNTAVTLFDEGNNEEALVLFQNTKGYKKSGKYIKEIQSRIYDQALTYYNQGDLTNAIACFEVLENYGDSAEQLERTKSQTYKKINTLNVGDTFWFGRFENQLIEWTVLDIDEEGNRLAITSEILTELPMGEENVESWEASSLRTELNDSFYNSFGEEEKEYIIDNKTTGDKIIILNSNEFEQYYGSVNNGEAYSLGKRCWLRDFVWHPGFFEPIYSAVYVDNDGTLTEDYISNVNRAFGVRPVILMREV